MAEYWDDFDNAMHDAADGLMRAAEGLKQGIEADQQLRAISKHARAEHEDMRETVARLERLVLELQTDIRALRARLNGDNGRL